MTSRFVRFAVVLIAALSFVGLSGCGKSKSDVAGTYELDKEAVRTAAKAEMEKQAESEEADGMAAFGSAMMLGMIESMSMTLTLLEDGSANMVMSMMGDSQTAKGTWTLSGSSITITMAEEGETPEPATGTVSGDTITLKPDKDEDMPFDLVFKKKA